METRRDVFQAIADPTRRQIIGLVAGNPLNLNAIAENFDISRQAISLHIKILTECGLIEIKKQGRERYCEAKLESLSEVHEWTDKFSRFWTNKLFALKSMVESEDKSDSRNKAMKDHSTTNKNKRK